LIIIKFRVDYILSTFNDYVGQNRTKNEVIKLMFRYYYYYVIGIYWENIIFQQDGALPHNSHVIQNYVNENFPNRWIETYRPVEWPQRSPNLSPLDLFLWGRIKTEVYADPPISLQYLKEKIRAACNKRSATQISATTKN
jgi:hypothetical protein